MRVLVTGAGGFIGSHTVAALLEAGHDVRVLVRSPERAERSLGPSWPAVEVAVGDVTDPVSVGAAIAGSDAVVHAAGEIGVDGGSGPGSATVTSRACGWWWRPPWRRGSTPSSTRRPSPPTCPPTSPA